MKLLIVTPKVDKEDENLGAFYYWFLELAARVDRLVIIAGSVGTHEFPAHVSVFAFKGGRSGPRIMRLRRFWELFSKYFTESDAVLFHMIPEYVLAASPFLVGSQKPSALWYAHKSVTARLRIAERLVTYIFTSSEDGFRIPSKKALWLGQAINTDFFAPDSRRVQTKSGELRMISVGRIAPVKNYEVLLDAVVLLKNGQPWSLDIVGGPMLARDRQYLVALQSRVRDSGLGERVRFLGPKHYSEIPLLLNEHDMLINLSSTGSLDKAVLEAMSCGLTVITANEAYRAILASPYFLETRDPTLLARRIRELTDEKRPIAALREIVLLNHDMRRTMEKIVSILEGKTSTPGA